MDITCNTELKKALFEKMMLGRKFEEKILELFSSGELYGTAHPAIGEEAACVGTVMALEKDDYVFGTHRGHVQAIAKGLDINAMMAEVFGRRSGSVKGTGGSMHIADANLNHFAIGGVMGVNAVVGCGTALKIKMKNEQDRITAVFFGDGTSNEGAALEAFNLASVWGLPVLFCCINNKYGMSTSIKDAMRDTNIEKRAVPFDIEAKTVFGNDVEKVFAAAKEARAYITRNSRPYLLVLDTYRTEGHSKSDKNLYRSNDEIEFWRKKCPISLCRMQLLGDGVCANEIAGIEKRAEERIEKAVQLAKKAPFPKKEQLTEDVFTDSIGEV